MKFSPKTLIRPAMLIVPLGIGFCLPGVRELAAPPWNMLRWTLCLMIFINVLQIKFADLKPHREHFYLLLTNILVGTGSFFLLKYLYPASVVPAQAAFFAGIAPTAASAAVIISLLNGRVGFAVTAFVISNIGIACALVFLLPLITGNFSVAFFYDVLKSLTLVIALPLLLAQVVQRVFPRLLDHMKFLKNLSLCFWSFSLFIMGGIARGYFDASAENAGMMIWVTCGISLALCVLNFLGGRLLSRRFSRETSQLLGQKNTSFAIFIALEYASGVAALSTIFYVLFHNLWNSCQLFIQQNRPEKEGD
jgi:BASS family bile acid:Na+ symporter